MDEVTLQCAALEEELDKAKRLNQSKMLERDQAMAECKEVCILYFSYCIQFFSVCIVLVCAGTCASVLTAATYISISTDGS